MRTLFHFISSLGKGKKNRTSLFEKEDSHSYKYLYSEVYLGANGKVILSEDNIEINMSYSVRDSLLVKIKRNEPYKILYNYIDGVDLILDEGNRGYTKLTERLNNLRERSGKYHHLDVYDRLEEVVYDYLVKEFKLYDSKLESSSYTKENGSWVE